MRFKKIIGIIHRWLGLSSGLVVFIVAITGCIYAFQIEIQYLTEPYRFVTAENKPLLPPSQIASIANKANPGKHATEITYNGKDQAFQAVFYEYEKTYDIAFIHPYTGTVLKVKDMKHSLFPWILEGHEFLWLPEDIGRPIVASATLIFLGMLLSGMILWWPRNKAGRRQRFSIKWNARWRRKNYDLHNVPGFYILLLGLTFAITGLTWGFEWFASASYKIASGGRTMVPYFDPGSDATAMNTKATPAIDQIWQRMQQEYPNAATMHIYVPQNHTSALDFAAGPDAGTYWKMDYRYFDQHTLREIPSPHLWKKYKQANGGDLLIRMAYDIHIGAIWGLPGKILVFFGSLIIASLPVTGFLIWWGRKKNAPGTILAGNLV
jgi:uncharacterized iron-regulated membrane protein